MRDEIWMARANTDVLVKEGSPYWQALVRKGLAAERELTDKWLTQVTRENEVLGSAFARSHAAATALRSENTHLTSILSRLSKKLRRKRAQLREERARVAKVRAQYLDLYEPIVDAADAFQKYVDVQTSLRQLIADAQQWRAHQTKVKAEQEKPVSVTWRDGVGYVPDGKPVPRTKELRCGSCGCSATFQSPAEANNRGWRRETDRFGPWGSYFRCQKPRCFVGNSRRITFADFGWTETFSFSDVLATAREIVAALENPSSDPEFRQRLDADMATLVRRYYGADGMLDLATGRKVAEKPPLGPIRKMDDASLGEKESLADSLRNDAGNHPAMGVDSAAGGDRTVISGWSGGKLEFQFEPERTSRFYRDLVKATQDEISRAIIGKALPNIPEEKRPIFRYDLEGLHSRKNAEGLAQNPRQLSPQPEHRCECSLETVRHEGVVRRPGDRWPCCRNCGQFIAQPKEATLRRIIFRVP